MELRVTLSISKLSVVVGGLIALTGPVCAQATWNGNAPVYDSEVKRNTDQSEADRAERRKSYGPVVYPKFMEGGARPDIQPTAPSIVYFDQPEEAGSIIVDTQKRKLYYVLPDKKAYEYPISVGRDGFTWSGTERISRIAEWPSWTPPQSMHQRMPGLPITVTGGLRNPQGARAMYLGSTIYRIHGTNNDRTVGRANSSGCFRLMNEHVVHLASIVKVGTKVKILQAYNGGVSQNAPVTSLFGGGGDAAKPAVKAKPSSPKPVAKKTAAAAPVATRGGDAPLAKKAATQE
jgi:lipoprotein-anchoring transpeptidase ErfK/SrfK